MLLACVRVLACYGFSLCYGLSPSYFVNPCYVVSPCNVVLAGVMSPLRGSRGLSAHSARRTKSRGMRGPPAEVGVWRAPRLLAFQSFYFCKYLDI